MPHNNIISFFMIFMGGVVVALNLTILIPSGEDYHASWFKVCAGVTIAILGSRWRTK